MTQQFEDFVNAALDKSLASDVTLPTANKIPVYTGIGRQVTGKPPAELGLAVSSDITAINSTLALKADLVDGVVPANQLPSYVDDVLEFANLASFPVTGESGKVYVAIDTKKTYRWSGSTYVQIGSDLALGETPSTAYRGDRGKTAYDHSQATGNPHGATTANINDSADRRYVTDAKLTVLNNTSGTNSGDETQASIKTKLGAASSGVDGYLTGSDWNTFNGKQAALADVITSNTYGNSTQWPIVTVNAKGIVTGVTLQTVPTPTLTDATFSVQKNGSPSIAASWNLTALTASRVHTYPNKAINFGDLPSVATTDENNLSGTRCRILGGSNNTVSGTDIIVIGGSGSGRVSASGTGNVAIACNSLTQTLAGTSNVTINCGSLLTASDITNCTYIGMANGTSPTKLNAVYFGTHQQGNAQVFAGAKLESQAMDGTAKEITLDGGGTPNATNCVGLFAGVSTTTPFGSIHDVEFIVVVSNSIPSTSSRRTVFAKRRVYAHRKTAAPTTASSVVTIDSDVLLGETPDGTITFGVTVDFANNRLVPTVTGVAGTDDLHMDISVRIISHYSRVT